MAITPTLPLQLCQVLEDEFQYLHGASDDPLPNWDFQPEHFPDPARLAAEINRLNTPAANFIKLALGEIATDAPMLATQFNELLAHTKLYKADRFPFLGLSDELKETIKLMKNLGAGLEGDDVRYFNRRLLEQTFPGYITDICDWRLRRVFTRIHHLGDADQRTALCLSGGGIRSATFSLGVLQGLARHDLLKQFHYLSTVSGGGYIGSWLSSWINRHPQGLSGVTEVLQKEQPETRIEPEPPPLRYLREYSNFLTPRLSFQSADVWSFIAIYLRNLIINWMVLIPLLLAAIGIPHIGVAVVQMQGGHPKLRDALLLIGFILIALSVSYSSGNRPSIGGAAASRFKFWQRRENQDSFLFYCLLPLVLAALLLGAYWAWLLQTNFSPIDLIPDWLPWREDLGWLPFVLFGIASYFLGWLIYLTGWRRIKPWELGIIFLTGPIGGWLLWLLAMKLLPAPTCVDCTNTNLYTSFVVPGFLLVFFLSVTVFVGLGSRAQKKRGAGRNFMLSEDDLEWFARFMGWLLIVIVCWSLIAPVVLLGPAVLKSFNVHKILAPFGGLTGLIAAWLGHSSATPANPEQAARAGWKTILLENALTVISFLFLLFLALELSLIFSDLVQWGTSFHPLPQLEETQWRVFVVSTLILLFLAFGLLMAKLINLNMFSLHAGYRNRLVRAYLGASHTPRKPNPFTGFDKDDNLRLQELRSKRLFHVVNTALNLVKGEKLAWQQRKAESFVFTPLHSGGLFVGFRRTPEYGGEQGVSLGTIATISGAAANSNMGYHSTSALVTFVLTLFNVRLGWWLGNPGVAGSFPARLRIADEAFYQLGYPNSAIYPILAEAFGLTDDRNSYVLLSDGGHFENLGLYEMVLRRCKTIVVVDAGQDGKCQFEDLGNALRKIRVDLGIPITFDEITIYSRERDVLGHYCALGQIEYGCVDGKAAKPGMLLYIKPAFYGDEPSDVYNYAQMNPDFPHESTVDQFFDEPQFESYRMLGSYIMNVIAGADGKPLSLQELLSKAEKYTNPIGANQSD